MDYCFTVNKQEILSAGSELEKLEKDSTYRLFKEGIIKDVKEILEITGINLLGDIAVFGNGDSVNFAWNGKSKSDFEAYTKKHSSGIVKHQNFSSLSLNKKIHLCYNWPELLLKNHSPSEDEPFFNKDIQKIDPHSLEHEQTQKCVVYGVINKEKWGEANKVIPRKGKMFAGISFNENEIKIHLVQPEYSLKGIAGKPGKIMDANAVLNVPFSNQMLISSKWIPEKTVVEMSKICVKPVNQLYCELLDTFSFSERYVTYDMDEEFNLTQRIGYIYKNFPGLFIRIRKAEGSAPDTSETKILKSVPDYLKLYKKETYANYYISSDTDRINSDITRTEKSIPEYYLYANIEKLKKDPFWSGYLETDFQNLEIFAEKLKEGTVFYISIYRKKST